MTRHQAAAWLRSFACAFDDDAVQAAAGMHWKPEEVRYKLRDIAAMLERGWEEH